MASPVTPGLLILHGNQMEQLRAALFGWLRNHPLAPLESEIILVQSNGVAEWLKIALAEEIGVCAATRVALPARFLWEAYRGMLGRERVPKRSPFDKGPLTWRLMRLLPALLADPVFQPLRHFLGDGDPERRLQLAERLSDLFDQYQVYRADWLEDWAAGRDLLRSARGEALRAAAPISAGRRSSGARSTTACRRRCASPAAPPSTSEFVRASEAGERAGRAPAAPGGPVRHLGAAVPDLAGGGRAVAPLPGAAGGAQSLPVLLGRHHRRARAARRQRASASSQRGGIDLSGMPLEELHAHSHPLLASWGRQGRDFVRMLDEFDTEAAGPLRQPAHRPVQRRRGRHAARRRCRRRCATCCRWPSIRARAAGRARPLDRIPRRPQRAARSRGAARPAAVVVRAQAGAGAAPARRGGDGARHRHLLGRHPRGVRPAQAQRSALHPVRDRRRQGPQRQSAAGGARMAAAPAAAALPPERGARPARRAGAGRALRPGRRRPADAGPVDRRRQRALGPGPAAPRRPRARFGRRTERLDLRRAAHAARLCERRRRQLPAASSRTPKWAGSMPRWPARWPS